MNNWYKLVLKQNQPIHIGSLRWGVVNETEIFIPGSTVWGALTNLYLQTNKNKIDVENEEELKRIGKFFEKISNFFPCFDSEGKDVLLPVYKSGELYLSNLKSEEEISFSEEEFRFCYTDVIVQTAIEPISRRAKDESLHELEYISPQPKKLKACRKKGAKRLYWVGVVKVEEEEANEFLSKCKENGLKVFIGGDTKYGFGEMEVAGKFELSQQDAKNWWIESNEITIKEGDPSPYFIDMQVAELEEGELVLVPELNFRKNPPEVRKAWFCASVGSKVNKSQGSSIELNRGKIIKKEGS